MALNFNQITIAGRLTADPELKQTQSGISVTSFTVAVNRRAKKGEEAVADFLPCVAWRQTAEFITKFFRKGSAICVTGSLQTRKWQDQNGNNRIFYEILANEALFVENKDGGAPQAGGAPANETFEPVDDDSLPF